MPEAGSFRQVDEKHVSQEVVRMLWSPKMDLVAIANAIGEVVLHRLSWQKVWILAPPGEDVAIRGLAWRPDGKVLAVGYSTGAVILCDVENSDVIHRIALPHDVTCMQWVNEVPAPADKSEEESSKTSYYTDTSGTFLPKLQPLNKSYGTLAKGQSEENVEDAKKLKGQVELNVLVIGNTNGYVSLYAYGIFPMATVDMATNTNTKIGRIYSSSVSYDLKLMSLIAETHVDDKVSNVSLLSFDTTLLASRHTEIRVLSLLFGQILTLMSYVKATIKQMNEAWEDILLEMDTKLQKFAEEKYKLCSGTVSNDFLELLMFGTPSSELQSFLLYELTEKGLKKLGHSIETSYSNIQKLVLKHLQSVGQSLVYYLSQLNGMSLWYDKFGVLGLSPQYVQEALDTAGAFMLKSVELQQVIDGSMKNFKAFFRWLYVVIQRLSNEPIPAELSKMTQQDFNFVAEFLKENFTEEVETGSTNSGFRLERVGQYLKDEDIPINPGNPTNPWADFVRATPSLKNSDILFTNYECKSLKQVFDMLDGAIQSALEKPSTVIGQSLQHNCMSLLFRQPDQSGTYTPKMAQSTIVSDGISYLYSVFLSCEVPSDKCYIMRQPSVSTSLQSQTEISAVVFNQLGKVNLNSSSTSVKASQHKILDISFYDTNTISFLLLESTEDSIGVLVQFPLTGIQSSDWVAVNLPSTFATDIPGLPVVDGGKNLEPNEWRRLENMKAHSFAVSGTRNSACVLFSSRRRVRLFLMDAEDDDDDDDEEEDMDNTNAASENNDSAHQDTSIDDGGDENKENADVGV